MPRTDLEKTNFTKDPQAVLDYTVDWSDWLADGETITSSTWTITGGLNLTSQSVVTTKAVVWLSGGNLHDHAQATNHVVTSEGRADDRTLTLYIDQR